MAAPAVERRQFLRLAVAFAATAAITACGDTNTSTPTAGGASSNASGGVSPTAATRPTTAAAPQPTAANLNVAQTQSTPVTATNASAQFKEAPMLADMVKAGTLPPVTMRLPASPRVLKPLEETGQYGGVWHRAYKGLSDRVGPTKLGEEMLVEWDAPDPNTLRLTANLVEKWTQNADATEFTFTLHKGLRWSDGSPVSTDDVKFWWDDMLFGLKDLFPSPGLAVAQRINGEFKPGTLTVTDAQTFSVKYQLPYPLLPISIAKLGGGLDPIWGWIVPSAYLKKIHPKYTPVDQLMKAAADRKLSTWQEMWGKPGAVEGPVYFWFLNPDVPTLRPWKIEKPTPADPVVMVRNPYYWQVDTEGNQLPYIDRIEHVLFDNNEVFNLKIASGQIDLQLRHTDLGSYTFYKENEKKGNYTVRRWRAASTDAYFFNINTPDPVLAKLFETPEFRQAMSIAINRQDINDLVWNGLGKPRQASPVAGSPEYDAEFEKVWTEYDPKKANDLLDKLGLMKGPDGFRKRSDGKTLEVTIEHFSTPASAADDAHQRVKKYWDAVGVKTNVKFIERGLFEERVRNGDIDVRGYVVDRASVVKADPGWWTSQIDWAWAPLYGHWYDKSPYKQAEPPMDHPIREIYRLWDATQREPDETKRNALFQQLIGVHKKAPYMIGTVGEKVQPVIVGNSIRNWKDGFLADDTLRDYGLINPQQLSFKK